MCGVISGRQIRHLLGVVYRVDRRQFNSGPSFPRPVVGQLGNLVSEDTRNRRANVHTLLHVRYKELTEPFTANDNCRL